MVLLELFSGNGDISKRFDYLGGKSFRVDWSMDVEAELHADINILTTDDIISLCNGVPNVVWASPQCTTYSIATHRHRTLQDGLLPKTDLAKQDDATNYHMWRLIDKLLELGTKYYFVENPRGRMRHMPFVMGRPRYTITYCSYGNKGNANGFENLYIMKPTDIWTNYPNPQFLPVCKKPYVHKHGEMRSGHKRDYLSRGKMPELLVNDLVDMLMC